jgi:Fe-S oxidoreductase
VTVGFFVQCLTDWLYPEMGQAIVEILRSLGAEVVFPRAQHCCGLPAIDGGEPRSARRMARHTIGILESCQADFILTGGTSCAIAMTHDYGHLFRDDPSWQIRSSRMKDRIFDFTSFMLQVARLPNGCLADHDPRPTAVHYFCQSYNILGFRDGPHALLRDVCGYNLVPLFEANVCCGFGGSVSFLRPELTSHILARKLDSVNESGAALLITDNPGCIMNLRGGVAARGWQVEVMHTAEAVAERVRAIQR